MLIIVVYDKLSTINLVINPFVIDMSTTNIFTKTSTAIRTESLYTIKKTYPDVKSKRDIPSVVGPAPFCTCEFLITEAGANEEGWFGTQSMS